MDKFFSCSLLVLIVMLMSAPGVASVVCEPVLEADAALSELQQLEANTKWRRSIDQDNASDIWALLPKVDVKITNDKGKTALMAAVKLGDQCLLQALLQRGLKISDRGYTGGTTLMYAVLGNQLSMIDLVLSQKPDLNAQSTNGWTAVMIAAAKGFDSAMSLLHEAGADVDLADVYGWTPLMRAMDNKHSAVVSYLLSLPKIDLEQVNENGSSALHIAAQVGDRVAIEQLLRRGVNRVAADNSGYSPATVALINNHVELAELIKRGQSE